MLGRPCPRRSIIGILIILAETLNGVILTLFITPTTRKSQLSTGFLWLALGLAFELGAGHYLFRRSWPDLITAQPTPAN